MHQRLQYITMRKNQIAFFEILSNFIRKSIHAIFASAFIMQNEKRAFQFNEEILTIKLVESIQKNEKNYVVFSSKTTLNTVSSILRDSINMKLSNDFPLFLSYDLYDLGIFNIYISP